MSKEDAIQFVLEAGYDGMDARAMRKYGYVNKRNPKDQWGHDIAPEAHDDRHRRLKSPHYLHDLECYREGAQTVFGYADDEIGYDYDDRIPGWYGHENWTKGCETATEMDYVPGSVAWYEVAMSYAYGCKPDEDKPIELDVATMAPAKLMRRFEIRHVMAGVNVSNGFPYKVFGYVKLKPPQEFEPRGKEKS